MMTYTNPDSTLDNAERIVELAYKLAKSQLEADGNQLDDSHASLIKAVLWTMADTCIGREPGRVAVPADTGLGKSTCLQAFIAAMAVYAVDTALLVLLPRVKDGEKIIARAESMADTIKPGYSAKVRSRVAHVHSYEDGLKVDDPSVQQASIVLATHQRASLESIKRLLRLPDGTARGIIIDEALHKADAFGLTKDDLRKALKFATGELRGDLGADLDAWAAVFTDEFERAEEIIRSSKLTHEVITVPAPKSVDSIIGAVRAGKRGEIERLPDNLIKLLENSSVDPRFRVLTTGIIQHRRVLPMEFDQCAILDATATIDALGKLDDGFQLAFERSPGVWKGAQVSKDWSDVSVECMPVKAGRTTMDSMARSGGWMFSAYVDKIVDLLQTLPPEDFVLVCTFKTRTVDTEKLLQAAIAAKLGHGALERLHWITYGNHDSTSDFAKAAAVVAVGEWNVSREVATAAALGAMEADDETHVASEVVAEVMASRVATALVQLAGRGRCRKVVSGRAQAMSFVFASGSERVHALVQKQMRGATFREWSIPPSGLKVLASKSRRASDSRQKLTADAVEYLRECEANGGDKVSTKTLWTDLNAIHLHREERARALEDALSQAGGWAKAGTTLVLVF